MRWWSFLWESFSSKVFAYGTAIRLGKLFRSNFKIVDNSKFLTAKAAQAKFSKIMGQGIDSFVKKPVKNPIGKTWIKNQKKLVKNKKRFN